MSAGCCTPTRRPRWTSITRSSGGPLGRPAVAGAAALPLRGLRHRRRGLTARGVPGTAVAQVAAALAAGQWIGTGDRQQTAALARLAGAGAAAWQADGSTQWTGKMSVAATLEASDAETVLKPR